VFELYAETGISRGAALEVGLAREWSSHRCGEELLPDKRPYVRRPSPCG